MVPRLCVHNPYAVEIAAAGGHHHGKQEAGSERVISPSMTTNARTQVYPTMVGHLIASVFGLVFVLVNGGILPTVLRVAVDVAAIAALGVVACAIVITERARRRTGGERYGGFPPRFWAVVAIEAVVLFGGLQIIQRVEPAANLGWIALVVGAHFFPLSRIFLHGRQQFIGIGTAMCVLGIAGLAVAFTTHDYDLVALIAGLGSGVTLLGTSVANAARTLATRNALTHVDMDRVS